MSAFGIITRGIHNLRSTFPAVDKDLLRWFPSHMGKGLKEIGKKMLGIDCVIEVHDARIPLSGRNPKFKESVIGLKPHILVLNKKDLADLRKENVIKEELQVCYGVSNVIYTNCKDQKCAGVKSVIPMAIDLINNSNRYHRENNTDFTIMVIGVPNVGKSSLINRIRNNIMKKDNCAPVGKVPGITRSMQTRIKVCENPNIFVLDTPGILSPNFKNPTEALRLAACAALQDHLVGPQIVADFILFSLNKMRNVRYVYWANIKEPTDNITAFLIHVAQTYHMVKKVRTYNGYAVKHNLHMAALEFITAFREGKFGNVILDDDSVGRSSG